MFGHVLGLLTSAGLNRLRYVCELRNAACVSTFCSKLPQCTAAKSQSETVGGGTKETEKKEPTIPTRTPHTRLQPHHPDPDPEHAEDDSQLHKETKQGLVFT